MPAAIPWSVEELQTLVLTSAESRVFLEQKRIPVVLQPFHLQDLKSAVRDLLNASVDSYDKSLDGILLSFKHLKVLSRSASVSAETSGVVLDIQADFYVFRPENGCILKGVVNKISKDHVGVLLYHRFNISCPRPSSETRSERWLGNHVQMHQEVTFKLKEKNFSGRLPFFRGKLLSCGGIVTEAAEEENKKAKKKKKKDKQEEESNLSVNVSFSSLPVSKSLKHKLDVVPEENFEAVAKRSKKDNKSFILDSKESVMESKLNETQILPEISLTKKKKSRKSNVGCPDEIDYIPRVSLDVSQLPDHLPPPNADSTHFDFGKVLPNAKSKSEKSKRHNLAALTSAKDELPQKALSMSNAGIVMDNNVLLSPLPGNENKNKKKKDKKKKNEFEQKSSSLEQTQHLKTDMIDVQGMTSHNRDAVNVSDAYFVGLKSLTDSPKKKKSKKQESLVMEGAAKQSDKKSKKAATNLDSSLSLNTKSHTQIKDIEAVRNQSKVKKNKISDNNFVQLTPQEETSLVKARDASPASKPKKAKKGLNSDSASSKHQRHKKDKLLETHQNDMDIASDDTIPPGQKTMLVTPKKQNSPKKVATSNSSTLNYFPGSSSMVDLDMGIRKGDRRTPIIFGSFDGKVVLPQESPMKSSPIKKSAKTESDSDTSICRKIIVSSSRRGHSSDSDDSEGDKAKAKSVKKQEVEDSDESSSETAVKSKLLQSMGIMQSPVKTATPNLRNDSSESDDSIDSSCNYKAVSKSPKVTVTPKSEKPVKGKDIIVSKSIKSISPSKTYSKGDLSGVATTPQKSSSILPLTKQKNAKPTKKKDKPSTKVSALNDKEKPIFKTNTEESDSDLDLELMKSALLQLQLQKTTENKRTPKKPAAEGKLNSKAQGSKRVRKNSSTEKAQEKSPSSPLKGHPADKNSKSAALINSANYDDSDSGPDDRNTTVMLEKQRQQRSADEEKANKKLLTKQPKGQKAVGSNTSALAKKKIDESSTKLKKELPKKGKISKGTEKVPELKDSVHEKKTKSKAKKVNVDEEISDVMQRLLQQANVRMGLA